MRRAYTLTEVLVATALSLILTTIIMTMAVVHCKVGIAVGNYTDMSAASRTMLSQFDSDVRMASAIKFASSNGSQEFVITPANLVDWAAVKAGAGTFVSAKNGADIRYLYSATDKTLYRQYPATDVGTPVNADCAVVLTQLESCGFTYFDSDDVSTMVPASVAKIIFSGKMEKKFTGITNTENTVSAAVILRGKPGARL